LLNEVVEDHLECGDARNGFARIRRSTPSDAVEAPPGSCCEPVDDG
jgi:hypothetical protein